MTLRGHYAQWTCPQMALRLLMQSRAICYVFWDITHRCIEQPRLFHHPTHPVARFLSGWKTPDRIESTSPKSREKRLSGAAGAPSGRPCCPRAGRCTLPAFAGNRRSRGGLPTHPPVGYLLVFVEFVTLFWISLQQIGIENSELFYPHFSGEYTTGEAGAASLRSACVRRSAIS